LLLAGAALWTPASSAASSKLGQAVVLTTAGFRFRHRPLPTDVKRSLEDTAGVIGLVLAELAVYAAYAVEVEDVLKRPLLPLGRLGKGEQAVKGTYAA
jgi:hypothetical protein